MPILPIAAAVAPAVGTIIGARSAAGASRRASDVQARSDAEAMAFERERDAEARRQWEADQAFQQQQFAAQEEERLYARRLAEEREARLAPYRQASAAALGRLGTILGIQVPTGGGMPSGGGGSMPSAAPMRTPAAPIDPLRGAWGHITRGDTRPMSLTLADIGAPGELMPVNTRSTLGAQLNLRSRRSLVPGQV